MLHPELAHHRRPWVLKTESTARRETEPTSNSQGPFKHRPQERCCKCRDAKGQGVPASSTARSSKLPEGDNAGHSEKGPLDAWSFREGGIVVQIGVGPRLPVLAGASPGSCSCGHCAARIEGWVLRSLLSFFPCDLLAIALSKVGSGSCCRQVSSGGPKSLKVPSAPPVPRSAGRSYQT